MKIKILLITIFSAWMFSSCFKDEGNYTYKPDSDVYGEVASQTAFLGEEIEIHPIMHWGNLKDTTQVRMEWYVHDTIVSTERFLRYKATSTQSITCYLTVYHPETGIPAYEYFTITATSPYTKGWCILYDKGGESELAHIAMSTSKNEETGETETEYVLYKDIYQNINGTSLGSEPVKITEHYLVYYKKNCQFLVIQRGGQGCVELDGSSLKKVVTLQQDFINEELPANFAPNDVIYMQYYHFVWNSDGNIYGRTNPDYNAGFNLTSFSNLPLYAEGGLRVDKILYTPYHLMDFVILYDGLNNRLIPYGSVFKETSGDPGVFEINPDQYPEGYLPLDNLGDYKLIYGSSCNDVESAYGNEADFSMLLHNPQTNKYLWQTFHVKKNSARFITTIPQHDALVEFPRGDLINGKNIFWMFRNRAYLFFTAGANNDQLWYFDTKKFTVHLYKDFNGKEITAMHPNLGYKQLGVGLKDGTFSIFDVTDEVLVSGQPKEIYSVDGIGKIVDVIYRYDAYDDHWWW